MVRVEATVLRVTIQLQAELRREGRKLAPRLLYTVGIGAVTVLTTTTVGGSRTTVASLTTVTISVMSCVARTVASGSVATTCESATAV